MKTTFELGDRIVGDGQPALITAELGLNHNGDPALARRMIDEAADAGADAVKFQVFRAESFISGNIEKARHQQAALDSGETLFDMWKRLELADDDLAALAQHARERGVLCYASAFDRESVRRMAGLGFPAFKIASGEVTNLPLLREMAGTGLPLLMSVGMADLGEIEAALQAACAEGNEQVGLLHCVANYPVEPSGVHLRRIGELRRVFGTPTGYSDHTTAPWGCIAAAALGASFLEKHVTLDKSLPGTDHQLSADRAELGQIVDGVRAVEAMLGRGRLVRLEHEEEGRTLFRRGLVALRDLPVGHVLTADDLTAKRPAHGIEPGRLDRVIGRTVRRALSAGAPVTWDDV